MTTQTPVPLAVTQVSLTSPVNFAEIYEAAERHLRQLQSTGEPLAILLSPGTAAMSYLTPRHLRFSNGMPRFGCFDAPE